MSSPRSPKPPRREADPRAAARRRYARRYGRDAVKDALGAVGLAAVVELATYLLESAHAFRRASPEVPSQVPPFEPPSPRLVSIAEHLLGVGHAAVTDADHANTRRIAATSLRPAILDRLLDDDADDDLVGALVPANVLADLVATPPMAAHHRMLQLALEAERARGTWSERAAALAPELARIPWFAAIDGLTALNACRDLLYEFRRAPDRARGRPAAVADRIFVLSVAARRAKRGLRRPTPTDLANLHGALVPERDRAAAKQRWRDRLRGVIGAR